MPGLFNVGPMARRKISNQEGLPDLTDKQMKFCEGILSGKSQRQSYLAAYDCKNMSDVSVDVVASRLRHDVKIALWLDAARSDKMKDHACTYDNHLEELERLKSIAIRTGNVGAAVQAEQLRGKAAGHYVEQHRDVTELDPLKTLKDIAAINPDLAKKLAESEGIPWNEETVH